MPPLRALPYPARISWEPVHRRAVAQEIYRNLHGILLPVDVVVVTERDVEQYGDQVGTILRPALREGQVIYEA
jgi:hypothetical protein